MRIFATKWMVRFARKQRIAEFSLREAIDRAECGLVDADLGGGLIKQRVARSGQGRSGGYRMIVAYREGDRAVFLYGFAKSEQENIDPDELLTLREIGAAWLAADDAMLAKALSDGTVQEVDG
ncbi:MAG: type II toxin-antitoxin system RelE/ParE family toxin [Agrobacterium tumefaciens]|jgi:hypothetical protein